MVELTEPFALGPFGGDLVAVETSFAGPPFAVAMFGAGIFVGTPSEDLRLRVACGNALVCGCLLLDDLKKKDMAVVCFAEHLVSERNSI